MGLRLTPVLIQDATGGKTVTFGSAYKLPAGVSLDTTANTRSVIEFQCVAQVDWVMTKYVTGIPA